jgi:hypothetical protein
VQGAEGKVTPSRKALRARGAAVVRAALQRLLEHGRRGRLGTLWEAALSEADRRLRVLEVGSAAGAAPLQGAEPCSLASPSLLV